MATDWHTIVLEAPCTCFRSSRLCRKYVFGASTCCIALGRHFEFICIIDVVMNLSSHLFNVCLEHFSVVNMVDAALCG